MKICILADSECLPRGESWGGTTYESTYPYLLDRALRARFGQEAPIVLTKGTRLATTFEVLNDWFEEVELRKAEIVVVQVGGGDCAPRTILPRERLWIDRLLPKFLRNAIYAFERNYRRQIVNAFPNRRIVPPEVYRANLREIRRRAEANGVRALIFVGIPDVGEIVEQQLPGVRKCGKQYNRILEEEARGDGVHFIPVEPLMRENGGPDRLTCDGSHFNAIGQRLLAAELTALIVGLLAFEKLQPDASGSDVHGRCDTISLL